jgi:hypothetical protein
MHLINVTAMTVDNINSAVAAALANSKTTNKTVEDYFKDLETLGLVTQSQQQHL